jgi:hypothetical protein
LIEETVTKTGNYTYSGGKLTLKSALLSAKDDGANVFVLHMSNGDTASVTVTVGA